MWKRKKKRRSRAIRLTENKHVAAHRYLLLEGHCAMPPFGCSQTHSRWKYFFFRRAPRQECTQRQTCGVIWPSPNRNYHRWDVGEGRSGRNQTGQASRQSGESGEGRGRGRAVILRYTAGIKMTQWLQIRKKYTILVSKNRPTKLKRV